MGASVAAVIIRREKELVAHFRGAGAMSAATAMSPSALGVEPGVAWNRLVARAVIREATQGAYYLDEPSWNALQFIRRRQVMVILLLALVFMSSMLLWRVNQ